MRYAHCLFCDDVRSEAGDKLSLMGVYGGELVATLPPIGSGSQSFPGALLPKLCIVGYVFTPIDRPFENLTFTISRDSTVVQQQTLDPTELRKMAEAVSKMGSESDPITVMNVVINVALSPYVISEPHILSLRFQTEAEELIAGKLRIRLSAPPT
ncbi:hypothetical protein AL520_14620 [Achromobacter xylosoxidans]|nr:hypothetical protein AL520_14620 [Achromobacter xylosoxidans]